MSSRRLALAFASLSALGALLTATPASALTHAFTTSFGASASTPKDPYPLTSPSYLAVDETTHEVYVTDPANHWVEKFDSSGNLIWIIGKGVDKSTGANLCTVASADQCQPGAQVSTPGAFTEPTFIAVDNSTGSSKGDVYVADSGDHLVSKFEAGGMFVSSWGSSGQLNGSAAPSGPFGELDGIAVNPSGDLFVLSGGTHMSTFEPDGTFVEEFGLAYPAGSLGFALDNSAGTSSGDIYTRYFAGPETLKFSSSGHLLGEPDLGGGRGLTVDSSNGDLYVDHGNAIARYESSGAHLETFGSPEPAGGSLSSAQGLAIDGSSHTVYVANSGAALIDVFPTLPQKVLEVTVKGEGSVSAGEPPISGCTETGGTCSGAYDVNSTVTLTAHPTVHNKFVKWTGCETEAGDECTVTMSAAKVAKAEFAPIPQANLELTVEGSGEVTSSPTGIACASTGGTCTAPFDTEGPESTVTLIATPSPDNHLVKWEGGGCSGIGTCQVTMSTAETVKAIFAPTLHTLTLTPTGPGSVSATTPASGIAGCEEGVLIFGQTCSGLYQEGKTATLTAMPHEHNHVTWSGCTHFSADTCEVKIGASDAGVGAAFSINTHTLTLTPTGPGSVSANSGEVSGCSAEGGICAGPYDETSTVTLTATPAAHYHLEGWSGCAPKLLNPTECEVTIGPSAAEVKASFAPNTLTLTVTPTGQGSVRANSGAISHCTEAGGTCAGQYIEAATVTLSATPGAHQAVVWEGCTAVPSADRCEVEIGASETAVKVSFAQITHTLTLLKAGTGQGSLTCDGGPCASSYPEGATLTLASSAASGSTFAGWSGAGCSGTGSCEVTLNADTTVTATFNTKPPPPVEEEKKPPPLKCHKGFVKKNGRCVLKPKPRHHKKKH